MAKKADNYVPETGGFAIFDWVIRFKEKHGILNIITSGILLIFMTMVMTIVANPSIIFDKWEEYSEMRHSQSFDYRMKSSKTVQLMIDEFREHNSAMRSFIIEMHNGKSNSAGLSFNYGSLTYESDCQHVASIMDEYESFPLDKYPIVMKIYEEGHWTGTIDELEAIDYKMAARLRTNDVRYIAVTMIYGTKTEIGFFGVTYGGEVCNVAPDKKKIEGNLYKEAMQLAPYLDGENAKHN